MVSSERIQVTLQGGAPWGFRLSGGGSLPLTINKIRKKSQAHLQGLQEGDAVISINGVHVHDKTQDEALELVEKAGELLLLEIFRDNIGGDKPKKAILVPGGVAAIQHVTDDTHTATFTKTSPADIMTDLFETVESNVSHGGFKLTATVDEPTMSTYETSNGESSRLLLISAVDEMTSSAPGLLESSPFITTDLVDLQSSQEAKDLSQVESSLTMTNVMATPFIDSTVIADAPTISWPGGSHLPGTQLNLSTSPRSQSHSPVPPPVSPKPARSTAVPTESPVHPHPSGVMSSSAYATFDDGQSRREVTSERSVQRSDDGSRTAVLQREVAHTTSNFGPSYVKSEQSAFNVVQSNNFGDALRSSSTTTTLLNTTKFINKKGPVPFTSTVSSNIQLPPVPGLSASFSTGNLTSSAPVFKPTKFVPGSGKKDVPGLFSPTSSIMDTSTTFKPGKENAPPMFQVKKIVSEKTESTCRDIWRPNVWLPGQEPSEVPGSTAMTPTEDTSPYATLPFAKKPGQSLVEEQKRKLFQSQISTSSKPDHDEIYMDAHDGHHDAHHGHHKRLHVFAPPVVIQADSGFFETPQPDDHLLDDDDDDASSQASSTTRRKKKLYADSAFYDAPGKNYPTITEQMKLCKKIAQSLTSAANKRARGAKMFMKRKRKSTKWVHEGHSEFSSSAGDVADLQDLDSELSPEEGGSKPLLYFKIPSLKHRISSEGKQTKMALSQEEFEKLRLNAKKCEHRAVAPDTCFDIVADLKAHKGKGGRMFEKRKQRSDKFVIDETNAKFVPPTPKIVNPVKPMRSEKTPWEAAMENEGKVDAAFSELTEWERNQRLNNKDLVPLPAVKPTLRSSESPHLLKGTNFNRTARGWAGGGEYPVADQLRPIQVQFAKTHGPMQPTQSVSRQARTQDHSHISSVHDFHRQQDRQPPVAPKPQGNRHPSQQTTWQPNQLDTRPTNGQNAWQPNGHDAIIPEPQKPRRRQELRNHVSRQEDLARQGSSARPTNWQSDRDTYNDSYVPKEYSFRSPEFSKAAYMQPIIPGTDL